jgi:ribonuclease HII
MQRAFEALAAQWPAARELTEAVVDGLQVPALCIPCRAQVKADRTVPEVMAASILAKTARDAQMEAYALLYPQYGYEKHKGYPTKEHRETIARYGPSPIQRKTFRVKKTVPSTSWLFLRELDEERDAPP